MTLLLIAAAVVLGGGGAAAEEAPRGVLLRTPRQVGEQSLWRSVRTMHDRFEDYEHHESLEFIYEEVVRKPPAADGARVERGTRIENTIRRVIWQVDDVIVLDTATGESRAEIPPELRAACILLEAMRGVTIACTLDADGKGKAVEGLELVQERVDERLGELEVAEGEKPPHLRAPSETEVLRNLHGHRRWLPNRVVVVGEQWDEATRLELLGGLLEVERTTVFELSAIRRLPDGGERAVVGIEGTLTHREEDPPIRLVSGKTKGEIVIDLAAARLVSLSQSTRVTLEQDDERRRVTIRQLLERADEEDLTGRRAPGGEGSTDGDEER